MKDQKPRTEQKQIRVRTIFAYLYMASVALAALYWIIGKF